MKKFFFCFAAPAVMLFAACSSNNNNNNVTPGTNTNNNNTNNNNNNNNNTTPTYYVKAKLDGTATWENINIGCYTQNLYNGITGDTLHFINSQGNYNNVMHVLVMSIDSSYHGAGTYTGNQIEMSFQPPGTFDGNLTYYNPTGDPTCTINVTSDNGTEVKGTFSGRIVNVPETDTIQITNGEFFVKRQG